MQSVLRLAFPPQCLSCHNPVDSDFGICGRCWPDMPFITGLICDKCGVPLPGSDQKEHVFCDDCMTMDRPWSRGRAVAEYDGLARKLILSFKHGDRLDLARPMTDWMLGVAEPLIDEDTVFVPVPLHRFRLLKRRSNQAAILARMLAEKSKRQAIPDLLVRRKATKTQDGMTRDARFANMADAIQPSRRAKDRLAGRAIMLVDDVMTSGATLAAASQACHEAGARKVDVLTLARVTKGP